ncbi:hypothetical protein Hanom_Chr15g01353331 [Helianthus anomalus]
MVKAVWWHVFNWLKIPWNMEVTNFNDLMEGIAKIKGSNSWKQVIELICYVVVWRIWKARNDKIFEGIPFRVLNIVDAAKEEAFLWLKHRSPFGKLVWERWRDFNVRDIIM